jgi:hypothetical protein
MDEHGGVSEEFSAPTFQLPEQPAEEVQEAPEPEVQVEEEGGEELPQEAPEPSLSAPPVTGAPLPADQPGVGRPANVAEIDKGLPGFLSSSRIVGGKERVRRRRERLAA